MCELNCMSTAKLLETDAQMAAADTLTKISLNLCIFFLINTNSNDRPHWLYDCKANPIFNDQWGQSNALCDIH